MKKIYLITSIVLLFFTTNSCQLLTSTNKSDSPKNIILMIGDGMGVSEVYAGLSSNNGQLNLEQCTAYGFSKTRSSSDYVTDSGAGGTAISTGVRTYNGAIGVGPDSLPLKTILEYAEENGLATGLISTSSVTHATPASFIAHQKSRNYYETIAKDFLLTDVDVVIGGGRNNFAKRADSVNLLNNLLDNGYKIYDQLDQVNPAAADKLYVFTADGHNPRASEGRGDMLPKSTGLAIEILKKSDKGFFMMVEGSMIDWGGHANDIKYITEEMIDFDKAIGEALKFAQEDGETLVLITADHETGGLGINGFDKEANMVVPGFTTTGHTGVMVPVFAYGPGSEEFVGIQKNTDLFNKMMKLLNLKHESEK